MKGIHTENNSMIKPLHLWQATLNNRCVNNAPARVTSIFWWLFHIWMLAQSKVAPRMFWMEMWSCFKDPKPCPNYLNTFSGTHSHVPQWWRNDPYGPYAVRIKQTQFLSDLPQKSTWAYLHWGLLVVVFFWTTVTFNFNRNRPRKSPISEARRR